MRGGFTLIEILIALAIIGALASVSVMQYAAWRSRSLVGEASSQIAQDIEKARSDAKRLNTTRQFYAATGTGGVTASSYALRDGSGTNLQTRTLPSGTEISQVRAGGTSATAVTLAFSAPHGTQGTAVAYYDIVVRSKSNTGLTRTVRVIGPMGKVVFR